jgi:acyl-coenzyme A synthetase/AMP-(fatty) acid ligase
MRSSRSSGTSASGRPISGALSSNSKCYFWFAGRDDDLINSSGYRIGPMEVENVLLDHPAVQECAVVGVPDAQRGELVKAFIVLRNGFEATDRLIAELQTHAKAKTAPYKYPRAIEFIAEMPLTPTGKIRRKDLRTRGRP